MTWTDKQLAEERSMSRMGEERYKEHKQFHINAGKETRTQPVKRLLEQAVHRFSVETTQFLAAEKKKRTKKHPMVGVFKELPVDTVALLTCKIVLDKLSKEQDLNGLVRAVGAALEDEVAYKAISKKDPKYWKALKDKYSEAKLQGAVRKRYKEHWIWGVSKRHRVGLWCVHMLLDTTKLFQKRSYVVKKRRRDIIVPTEETLKWISEADDLYEGMKPFYLPTTAPPKNWVNGQDGGYTTPLVHTKTFVKVHHKHSLKLLSQADLSVIDRGVNRLQRVPWKINTKVLEVYNHLCKTGSHLASLPSLYDQELPPKPPQDSPPEAWRTWSREAGRIHRFNLSNTGKYLKNQTLRQVANSLKDELFYFPQRLDFRGRVYPLPNYLNIQGDDLSRSLLMFGKSEPIGNHSVSLMIHVANVWGQDKKSIQERLEWYYQNEEMLCRVAKDPLEYTQWTTQAKPWQCLAAAYEVQGLKQYGTSFLTSLPVAMDCTNNGLQMYSLLMRDPNGAYWTNCTTQDKRLDIYQEVADATVIPECWGGFLKEIPREGAKRPVMTLAYGATKHSCRKYILQWFEETYLDPIGNGNPFGKEKHYQPCHQLADNLWTAIGGKIGKALEVMDWMREVAYQFDTGIQWTSPSGLPVYQRREQASSYQVKTKVGHTVRIARYRKYNGKIQKTKMQDAFPPNFIHSLDASVVHQVAASFPGPLGTIHDSFLTTAPSAISLKDLVRYEVASMFDERDILGDFHRELIKQSRLELPDPPSKGDFDVLEVIRAPYFIS